MKAGSKKVHSSKCLLGTLASSIFGNLLAGKPKTLELVKEQLEQVRIFNATSSFNLF